MAVDRSPSTQQPPNVNIFTTPKTKITDQPQTFQFRIIGDIQRTIYERMLGYAFVLEIKKDASGQPIINKATGQPEQIVVKKKMFDPIVTDWGANRITTLLYQFINEQTPFAHITGNTVIKMTNIFLKQLNADMYKNFERYLPEDQRSITMWRLILTTTGFIILEVLSRGIEGREAFMFYNQQQIRLGGQIPTQGGLRKI